VSDAEFNFLSRIPGEIIGAAASKLADDVPSPQEVAVTLADGTQAVIKFERFHQRRGRERRTFWTPVAARRV
jgi:hypothetical protein